MNNSAQNTLYFCTTAKSGLGHVRRLTLIARALKQRQPAARLALLTNAEPAGLSPAETTQYTAILTLPKKDMVGYLRDAPAAGVVVDTAVLPDLHELQVPRALVLRETIAEKLTDFSLPAGLHWDLLLLPNPAQHWQPMVPIAAHKTQALGWIYRRPTNAVQITKPTRSDLRKILITAGGGGGKDCHDNNRYLARLIATLRRQLPHPLLVRQALGPRAAPEMQIDGVDERIQSCDDLHEQFSAADLVVSGAGYNSVLELACTDVPVLLLPIDRTYDDQFHRARQWRDRLGRVCGIDEEARIVDWMVDVMAGRLRRRPVALGASGAVPAARLLCKWI